jgi:hypothetical protein
MGCSNTDINNFVTFRGDDLSFKLNFADTEGVPIDITGWTIFFTLKLNKDDSDSEALVSKTITTIPDPASGTITVVIPHTEVDDLTGPYYYDFQYKDASDNVRTITSGAVTFEKDITRRTA